MQITEGNKPWDCNTNKKLRERENSVRMEKRPGVYMRVWNRGRKFHPVERVCGRAKAVNPIGRPISSDKDYPLTWSTSVRPYNHLDENSPSYK